MKEKKSFVLRIDQAAYNLLEKWAADEFRSVNGQIEYLLQRALIESGRKKPKEQEDAPARKK
ncbi:Arc family DNA binding domain-containing protein [Niabella sp. CC-SYL272]|uniref:Arc family DNA binding domain-containing protein n=1 Tax=Niabella agricola TaxID=2891571 RepID=UPI001F4734E8|nr:Arc family DNA binding domain-containing protein [Niabella agricola]MCF3108403.1 Arc family DNA binding domain-containing protein [Niabella agricola]